jgi:hypothetical protein
MGTAVAGVVISGRASNKQWISAVNSRLQFLWWWKVDGRLLPSEWCKEEWVNELLCV